MFLFCLAPLVGLCILIGLACLFPVVRDLLWGVPSNESGWMDE
jgi:hypothetical protein